MDYEIAYNKALERAREELGSGSYNKGTIEYIFPELKESEDEKNIKNLIDELKCSLRSANCQNEACNGGHEKRIALLEWAIAWLEKQVEQKPDDKIEPTDYNSIDPHFGKPIDKVILKFNVGEWVIFNNKHQSIYQIEKIENGYYNLRHIYGGSLRVCVLHDESLRLWSIADVKDGDILQLGTVTAIFRKYIGNEHCKCYCSVCNGKFEIPSQDGDDSRYGCHNATPATKEQRELLFNAMREEGYEWNVEKKELKKIEQKSTWSEEDEDNLDCCIGALKSYYGEQSDEFINWIKSLKERI